jgi:hypothetical protein
MDNKLDKLENSPVHESADGRPGGQKLDHQEQTHQEEPAQMLDVHPPHHAASTWRDFFIHIATIVIGLLIAIGLEQTVERIHRHYELRETREALEREQKANEKAWADDEHDWRKVFVELKNNLTVLEYIRQHPGVPQTALPGELRWGQSPFMWNHAVWDAAQQKGVVQLMSLEEANTNQEFYGMMTLMSEQSLQAWNAINDAHRFDILDPDPTHLSAQQLDQVIQLTLTALQKHILFGYSFGRFAGEYPERPHTITWNMIQTLRPQPSDLDSQGMAAAHRKTAERLKGANGGVNGTAIDPEALR